MRKITLAILLFTLFLFACSSNEGTITEPSENTIIVDTEQDTSNKEKQPVTKADEQNSEETAEEKSVSAEKNPHKASSDLTVHYIDVGQGDATLFEYADGEKEYRILYDTGDWKGNEVVPYLQEREINFIDIVIISHPHADHIGQLEKVMQHFDVGEVWMSGNTANTQTYQQAIEAVLDSDAEYSEPTDGDIMDVGSLTLTILHPGTLTGGLNEDSLAIKFTYGAVSFLFTGDAYQAQEKQMMQKFNDIQADFIQLGHHGSNTSSSKAFLQAVNPKYAIYSAGTGNSYGHPHKEIVDLVNDMEVPLYGTDIHGTITVTTDGNTSKINATKDGRVTSKSKSKKKKTAKKKTSDKKQPTDTPKSTNNCIDLNTADKSELMEITQIGDDRADQIIEIRKTTKFSSVDDLANVKGIADGRLKEIKEQGKACIGG